MKPTGIVDCAVVVGIGVGEERLDFGVGAGRVLVQFGVTFEELFEREDAVTVFIEGHEDLLQLLLLVVRHALTRYEHERSLLELVRGLRSRSESYIKFAQITNDLLSLHDVEGVEVLALDPWMLVGFGCVQTALRVGNEQPADELFSAGRDPVPNAV